MPFRAVSAHDLHKYHVHDTTLDQTDENLAHQLAHNHGIPNNHTMTHAKLLLACLIDAKAPQATLEPMQPPAIRKQPRPHDAIAHWKDLRPEARSLLALSLKREGFISDTMAAAATLLNQKEVVESYRADTSRRPREPRHVELDAAREHLGGGYASTAEWLVGLADALEAPASVRPWYSSKLVLGIGFTSIFFVLGHVVLLFRVLSRVHASDSTLLLLPVVALGASTCVALLAVCVNYVT